MLVKLTKKTTCEIMSGVVDSELTFPKNKVFVVDPNDDYDDDFYMSLDNIHDGRLINVIIPKENCVELK